MVDHEGKIKEVEWHFEQTGPASGSIFPTIHEYMPENAPDRLMPTSHPHATAAHCMAAAAAVPAMTALEAGMALVLVGILLAWLFSVLSLRQPPQPATPAAAANPASPIVLADFAQCPHPPSPDRPACSHSSFVTKLEAFLRFAGIPYSKRVAFPTASPKAQLPFIERGSQRIGDSHFIIKHLVSSDTASKELECPPCERDKAVAVAVSRLCDNDLTAAILHHRWVDGQGWKRCQGELLGAYRLPVGVSWVVGRMVRKAMLVRLTAHGFARHDDADRRRLVQEQLGALAALLGDGLFLFGDAPCAADASAFGVLDEMAARALNPALADLLEGHPNLMAYRERIRKRYFGPDYKQQVAWLDGPAAAAGTRPSHITWEQPSTSKGSNKLACISADSVRAKEE